jgi:hypothetical protein
MSGADLRSSIRGALSHRPQKPEKSVPYLDKISVSKHAPAPGKNKWKRLLIQPICMPDLSHTGIETAFGVSSPALMRPDGSVDVGLKALIKSQYVGVTRGPVDEKTRRELADTKETKCGPGAPSFENFLDFVYGPSNISGEYRRNYEQQMRLYNPVEDERKPEGTASGVRLLQVSPNPDRELFTTNINYDSSDDGCFYEEDGYGENSQPY